MLYVAILVNEITVDGPSHVPKYEESIVLLRAGSDEKATRIAHEFGHRAESSYLNEDGEVVRWSFRGLVTIGESLQEALDHPW